MDGGATATEHLLGTIDDSGSTRGAGRPSCCPARGAESIGQRSRRRTPLACGTRGSLSALEVGGRSVLTSPTTRATRRARWWVLAAVGEVLAARRALPGDLRARSQESEPDASLGRVAGVDARKNLIISADASGPRGSV